MRKVFVTGIGAVSPAGWGAAEALSALSQKRELPRSPLDRPGWSHPVQVLRVPASGRPKVLNHARLRRASAISSFLCAAGMEAISSGLQLSGQRAGAIPRVGLVVSMTCGCVIYSRRFYAEALRDPGTASPLLFPETVFNAPASHLAAVLSNTERSYTLVGDAASFIQALALGAGWIARGELDGCIVAGGEELDWLVADAARHFERSPILSEGAGALYLSSEPGSSLAVELAMVTDLHSYAGKTKAAALEALRGELPTPTREDVLASSWNPHSRRSKREQAGWNDWPGSLWLVKEILGEGFCATAAWQCLAACHQVATGAAKRAQAVVAGHGEQAAAAVFTKSGPAA